MTNTKGHVMRSAGMNGSQWDDVQPSEPALLTSVVKHMMLGRRSMNQDLVQTIHLEHIV